MRKLVFVVSMSLLLLGACKKKEEAKTEAPKTTDVTSETKPAETKPAETKPAETKPAETKPVEAAAGDEAKFVATMENLGKTVADAGKDCDKLAANIKKFAAENKGTLEAMKKWEAGQTPEQKKALDEKYKPQMDAMMKNMMGGMEACAENKAVEAAFKELPLE
jgi:hypothetical protein